MNRHDLDRFAADHRLGADAIAAALSLAGQKPDADEWRAFASMLMRSAGLAALGAGALFFVAANWQAFGLIGRFTLLQAALLASVAVAFWRPPPASAGQAALIIATLMTGGLLALFGQSYQTGADLYELFFTWAALGLPFAVAGLSGAHWGIWCGVLNVALALLCGWAGPEHFILSTVFGRGIERSSLLMLPCLIDLIAAGSVIAVHRTRWRDAAPPWLARALTAAGFGFGTLAVIVAITSSGRDASAGPLQGGAVVLLFTALSLGIAVATLRHRRDVFPMALLSASWTAIGTAWLAQRMRFDDVGSYFLIAVWLIAASTASGILLMRWVRAWQPPTIVTGGATV